MADFFIGTENRLQLFGGLHITLMVLLVAGAAAVFLLRERLKTLHTGMVRIISAWLLLGNMLLHYGSKIVLGVWEFGTDLPLHLCFITNFLMIYILFTDNRHGLYRYVYYFTFIGPLPAIILPDLRCSYDSYVFYQFIISHHVMLLISLYCLSVLGYKTRSSALLPAFLGGNVLIGAVMLFNACFGTNYIMIAELPQQLYELMPFLYSLPPLFWLELAGVTAMLVACLPSVILDYCNSLKKIRKVSE